MLQTPVIMHSDTKNMVTSGKWKFLTVTNFPLIINKPEDLRLKPTSLLYSS
jgi:hypothetical protein